ncbi:MAG: hypothetical protein IIB44_11060 [Candidatus Marinimicrobia bacterium]|nr:hypothetical protein [Candidatus Neomarinimicrobiota bacterium]
MKQLNFSLVILLFIGITYAQAQVRSQTEELDITQIEEKAKVEARTDFDISKKLTWGVGSTLYGCLTFWVTFSMLEDTPLFIEDHVFILVPMGLALSLGPSIASKIIDVDFPETRQMEIINETERYQSVYRSKYISEIKKRRLTYSLAAPVGCVVTGLGLLVYFLLFGIAN